MTIQIKTDIELGWRVRDSITGFTGITTAFGTFLNGCERIGVTPEKLKDGKVLDTEYFDVQQLVVLDKKPKGIPKVPQEKRPGGPRQAIPRSSDPR
jgi:hypothetical protein